MGLRRNPNPRLMIYVNDGEGFFDDYIVDTGHPTHEVKVADIGNTGALDIVGKPFNEIPQVDLWKNLCK